MCGERGVKMGLQLHLSAERRLTCSERRKEERKNINGE